MASPPRLSEALAPVFAALGDPTRLKIIALLCTGGAFASAQVTATTEITRQAVTKHLQVLAEAGMVRDLKLGRERLWELDPQRIEAARQALETIGQQWDAALGRLQAYLEGEP